LRLCTHAISAKISARLYVRRGKTLSTILRSCDTVSAGAFFPQAPRQVPQKDMRQHRRPPMGRPARVCADGIVIHTACSFACFEALFHGPPQTTEPDQGAPGGARRGLTDGIGRRRLGASCPLEHEPDRAVRQAALTQRHALPGTRIRERPLRPF
jgi:hypothetical protein